MNIQEIVKDIRELKRMQDELQAEIEAAENQIKEEMKRLDTYTMTGTDYKVTWNEVISTRIDTKALKAELPDVVQRYTKTTTSRRFLVA
jgi:predicted phage-related endonuclease